MITKSVSCGILLTNGILFLVGKLSNFPFWDIPKGAKHPEETPLQAAIREAYEETNVTIRAEDVVDLGQFQYRDDKDLHLFLFYTPKLPPVEKMKCTSFIFPRGWSEPRPEMDTYKYIAFGEKKNYLGSNLVRVLDSIEKNQLLALCDRSNLPN